jgi:RNA polymerase sigma factor (sigma-70 family)
MTNQPISLAVQRIRQLAGVPASDRLTDQELVDRFVAARDEDAFAALVGRHGPMVGGVCRRVLRDPNDVEDALQATFLILARKAASIRKRESVASWLHGVARRVARQALVDAERRLRVERQRPVAPPAETCDSLTWREIRVVLDEELGRLPRSCQAPLILCYLEGRTQDEAADRLGWSKSTLRRRLERGRQLLQGRLARRGVTLSVGLSTALLSELAASAALPTAWTTVTVKAALAFAANPVIDVSSKSIALAQAVLKSAVVSQCKQAAVGFVTLTLLVGVGLGAYHGLAEPETTPPAKVPPILALEQPEPNPAPVVAAPVDQFGDALPADALARLGTIRLQHGALVETIVFAPDGKSFASAGSDNTVHIWETATGKELLRIDNDKFHGMGLGVVTSLAFAPDGKTLAGTRINQQPCIWEVATGKAIRQFGVVSDRAAWIVFSPDGKTMAVGGSRYAEAPRLIDAGTGNDLHKFDKVHGAMTPIAFSPDKKTFASAADKGMLFFELAAGQARQFPRPSDVQPGRFRSLSFSRDGKTLAAVKNSAELVVMEVPSGIIRRTITIDGKNAEVYGVALSLDGSMLISGHEDGLVRFWDTATGAKRREFRAHTYDVLHLALSPDGQTLATSSYGRNYGSYGVRLWETATVKPLLSNPDPGGGIAHLVFSSDGQRVATASGTRAVHSWDPATGKMLWKAAFYGRLAFTPDSRTLICAGWSTGKIHFLDSTTGKESRQFLADAKGIQELALSRDGKILVTSGGSGFLRLWDVATGRALHDFGGKPEAYAIGLALSPDAKHLASIHGGGYGLRLWDTATGKLIRGHADKEHLGSVVFSPDGKIMAYTRNYDSELKIPAMIQLCDVATGKEIRQLMGCGISMDSIAFSPDGRCLIWGGQHKKEMILWEVATGTIRRKFSGHQGHPTTVTFSPDGRTMASGSTDSSVLIWDAAGALGRRQPPMPLSIADLDKLWADLSAGDAAVAYQAICTLRSSPRQAVWLFEKHLKPVQRVDAMQVAEALRNLESEQFVSRNQAAKTLEAMGDGAEPALRKALAGASSLESRRRVELLLDRLVGSEPLRQGRALEVLENAADDDCRRLLDVLASGAPQARRTEDALAALDRLGQHASRGSK